MTTAPTGSAPPTALLLIDLQNDFLHPDGAYARGGVSNESILAVAARVAPLAELARDVGVAVVASRFTLHAGLSGDPLVSEHLFAIRPFLGAGDFAVGTWGHQSLDELGPMNTSVDKVAYSAFAHTHLDWWLRRVGVENLVVAGITTNGGVASTVRDAHVRDYDVNVLSDGCAAFDADLHSATLLSLSSVATITDIASITREWTP